MKDKQWNAWAAPTRSCRGKAPVGNAPNRKGEPTLRPGGAWSATRLLGALCVIASSTACASDVDGVVVDLEDEQTFGIGWDDYRSRAIVEEDGSIIAEGDLLFPNESALRAHYDQMAADKSKLVVIQRLSDGFEPVLTGDEQMNLTYCVANTFANKSTVVSHMAGATKAWEDVVRLRFVYVPSEDAACNENNANVQFAVMPTTVFNLAGCAANKKMWNGVLASWGCRTSSAGPYIKGVVLLNYNVGIPAGQTREGVVRHELGHMLGFRHEHPWDSPATCPESQTVAGGIDITGRQLTPYDVASVMHYTGCDGLAGTDYHLSPLDGEGARSIYGMPAAWFVPLFGLHP